MHLDDDDDDDDLYVHVFVYIRLLLLQMYFIYDKVPFLIIHWTAVSANWTRSMLACECAMSYTL